MKKKLSLFIIAVLIFLFLVPNSQDNNSSIDNNSSNTVTKLRMTLDKIKDGATGNLTKEDKEELRKDFSDFIYRVKNIITDEEIKKINQKASELFKEINNALWNDLTDSEFEKALVKRAVDGDTIVVVLNGLEEKVRLIGVNTPESAGRYENNPQPYGKEASRFTKRSLIGKIVYFEKDVENRDKYERLLRYVWLTKPSEGSLKEDMFNAILLKEGYGQVMTIKPNVKYEKTFLELQNEAKKNKKGLWKTK